VMCQILNIVGLFWVGTAARLGPSHVTFWMLGIVLFYRLSAGICKIGPFYATFFILLTAMNSTLVTACRLAFSSR
jgi:hypothetical protein